MRLFFALALPDDVRSALAPLVEAARQKAGDAVGFTRVEQLHFTLAFLGETPKLDDALAAGASSQALPPFEVELSGRGAFPGMSRPRVLWLGVGQGARELTAVAERLCGALRERGFTLEDRPFRPHLTLGRVRPHGASQARRALEAIPPGPVARFTAREIALVQSVLGPNGAKHTALRPFGLKA